ncbi:MAG: penicillin acylase family protein [Myxococcota bacterium]
MERILLEGLLAGVEPSFFEGLFGERLRGWDPQVIQGLAIEQVRGFSSSSTGMGGSNAWAVTGERSLSGKPILCGDPHLQVDQLPALLFELRVRLGQEYWLGATIPGLPGIAVGRNRHVVWTGTFAVADNVDSVIERYRAVLWNVLAAGCP